LNASAPPSPPEPIDLARLREELAGRYGILVNAEDPILAAVALNDLVLNQHFARIDAALVQHSVRLAEIDQLRQQQQQSLAKRVLGEALQSARGSLRQETAEAIATLHKAIREPIAQEKESRWRFLACFLGLVALIGWVGLLLVFFKG
jgi:hypothetical protein